MLCDKCGQNPATIHMVEYVNGKQKEIHLCETCVQQTLSSPLKNTSLNQVMSEMIEAINNRDKYKRRKNVPLADKKQCPVCGEIYGELSQDTILGCPEDYFVFHNKIKKVLSNDIGENYVHSGKLPSSSLEETISENIRLTLVARMEKAVSIEDYEGAAEIRDQLRNLR